MWPIHLRQYGIQAHYLLLVRANLLYGLLGCSFPFEEHLVIAAELQSPLLVKITSIVTE